MELLPGQADLGVILGHHPDVVLHDAGLEVGPPDITIIIIIFIIIIIISHQTMQCNGLLNTPFCSPLVSELCLAEGVGLPELCLVLLTEVRLADQLVRDELLQDALVHRDVVQDLVCLDSEIENSIGHTTNSVSFYL